MPVIKREINHYLNKLHNLSTRMFENHLGAYAAQSAFFFVLSIIPLMLLLLTIVQLTPITKADIMTVAVQIIPESHMQAFLIDIINEVYNQSRTMIPITAVTALWSASKAVLSLTEGLNCVFKCRETRNYILLRIIASIYTIIFIVVLIVMLGVGMFGKHILALIGEIVPFIPNEIRMLVESKVEFGFFITLVFAWLIYSILPNNWRKKKFVKKQWIGAAFTAAAWMLISYVFSMYLTIFQGFMGLYGSMTAIVLVMLWLYFSMYAMLFGGMINQILGEMRELEAETQKKKNKLRR